MTLERGKSGSDWRALSDPQEKREALDDAVSDWHDDVFDGRSLHAYLGMTWAEYARWTHTGELPS